MNISVVSWSSSTSSSSTMALHVTSNIVQRRRNVTKCVCVCVGGGTSLNSGSERGGAQTYLCPPPPPLPTPVLYHLHKWMSSFLLHSASGERIV